MSESSVSSLAIYQLRGVSPLVWRRLLVVSETSLGELHEILQSAFDWSGEHLHRFLIHGAAVETFSDFTATVYARRDHTHSTASLQLTSGRRGFRLPLR